MKKSKPVSRSGRFTQGPGEDVARFTESISFDWRLWRYDILGSLAHATMLRQAGLLSQAEAEGIIRTLDAISQEIAAGHFTWKPDLEDVHMNIEAELTRREPAGAKLHTGRSRNDQVALDMRLWLRDEIDALILEIRNLQSAMVELGARHSRTPLPGYTHADCDRVDLNPLAAVVTWRGQTTGALPAGQCVRLHLQLESARLYALACRPAGMRAP